MQTPKLWAFEDLTSVAEFNKYSANLSDLVTLYTGCNFADCGHEIYNGARPVRHKSAEVRRWSAVPLVRFPPSTFSAGTATARLPQAPVVRPSAGVKRQAVPVPGQYIVPVRATSNTKGFEEEVIPRTLFNTFF
jgi:hypothetical protein